MGKFNLFFTFLLSFVFLSSCKKDDLSLSETVYNADGTPKRKVANDERDSVYFYAQLAYLWYKNLPNATEFNPLKYSTAEEVINSVKSFSEKGPDGASRDKWSFVMDKAAWAAVASGNSSNFGAFFRFAADGNLYVRQVFAKSSAGQSGVQRGWKVLNINGIIPINNDTFIDQINTAFSKNTVTISFEKPDKSVKEMMLSHSDYQTNTIQEAKVFEEGEKKIGYFCFTDFLGDGTSAALKQTFDDFKSKGVNELVIDLRYNGGGYVTLAQELANLVAPSTASGKVMFTYQYNDKLSKYSTTSKFSTNNKLALNKIVFITTKNSASASELLINSLKPHMDVKIVGSASHGKPVGYPIIPLKNIVVAPVAFKTINSLGQADYYSGFTPDFPEVDDLTKNFGDPAEKCLKVALEYLKTGKVLANSQRTARAGADEKMQVWNDKLPKSFEGMFDDSKAIGEAIKKELK